MEVSLNLTARMLINQLRPNERAKVDRAVGALRRQSLAKIVSLPSVQKLRTGSPTEVLYAAKVSSDLRLLFSVQEDKIEVVDVVRYSQVESLLQGGRKGGKGSAR